MSRVKEGVWTLEEHKEKREGKIRFMPDEIYFKEMLPTVGIIFVKP